MTKYRQALLLLLPATAVAAFPFFSSFDIPKTVVAGSVLAPLIILFMWGGQSRWDSLDLVAAAYLLVSLPAYLAGGFVLDFLIQLHLDLAAVACFVLARRAVTRQNEDGGIRWFAGAGAVVGAFFLLERLVPPWPELGALPGSSTLGNPDLVAEFAAFCLPATLALVAVRKKGRWWTRVPALALALGLLGIQLVLASATAWIASAVALLVMAGFVVRRRFLRVPGAVVGALILLAIGGILAGASFTDQAKARWYLYRLSAVAALDKPVMGHGAGTFPAVFMEAQGHYLADHREDSGLWTNARHAHNQFLHLWVERGVGPIILLLVLAGLCIRRAGQRKIREQGWVLATLAVCLALFSGSITWKLVPVRLGFFILLGLCAGKPGPQSRPIGRWRYAAGAIIVAYLAIFPIWRGAGDLLFTRGHYEASLAVNPLNGRTRFFRSLALQDQGDLEGGCRLLENSQAIYPNLSTLLALGNCKLRLEQYEEAQRWYFTAIRWKPTYSLAYANLAALYWKQGKPELSARHIIRARSLNPANQTIRRIFTQVCKDNRHCHEN